MQTNELQQIAISALNDSIAMLKVAGNAAITEAPGIAKEYIAYSRVIHMSFVVFGICSLLLAVYCGMKLAESERKNSCEVPISDGLYITLGLSGLVFGFVLICENFEPAIKSIFAPKILLIEKANNLLHGK